LCINKLAGPPSPNFTPRLAESRRAWIQPCAAAVFLSYASQDAAAAARICGALRAAGTEVWFDQSVLRGGDARDSKTKKQIDDCALFVPLISAHTNPRIEG